MIAKEIGCAVASPQKLFAPFPYFGGKRYIADLVWDRFGDISNLVDPFFGSGAILLARPYDSRRTETVNDLDSMLANFWRALQADPDQVAYWADWPQNEVDLTARHLWLVNHKSGLTERMMADPDYYDVKIAGWWVWGICCWIGSGWCSGHGPWQNVDGVLKKVESGAGVNRQMVHLGNTGRGINRQMVHLGDAGRGINRQLPYLKGIGNGYQSRDRRDDLLAYFHALAARLRRVRVCCGDWSRVCGLSPTTKLGMTGVFLDPPYSTEADRNMGLYAEESSDVAQEVRVWAIAHGDDPLLRICLCGYEGEHDMPDSWECVSWKTRGGYGSQGNAQGRKNAYRERVWFSPNCLKPTKQVRLFDAL